jgi:hypothetical protein
VAAQTLVEIMASVAPNVAPIVERLVKSKFNTNQILTVLVALNIEQSRKIDCIIDSNSRIEGLLLKRG